MEALVLEGMTPREVSKRFEMSEGRLSILRKSPLWQIEEKNLREERFSQHKGRLESMIPLALDALNETVVPCTIVAAGTPNEKAVYNEPRVRQSAAEKILNIGGFADNVNLTIKQDPSRGELLETLEKINQEKVDLRKELGIHGT